MSTSRLEMSVFDGRGDYGSWKKRIKVYLLYYKVAIALEPDEARWLAKQKTKAAAIKEEASNFNFLHLADSIIHKVDNMITPLDL